MGGGGVGRASQAAEGSCGSLRWGEGDGGRGSGAEEPPGGREASTQWWRPKV